MRIFNKILVQRIARTGRSGKIGNTFSFINDKNENIYKDLVNLLIACNQEIPEFLEERVKNLNQVKASGMIVFNLF